MFSRIVLALVCSLVVMLQGSADYPAKPVRIIKPFGAGGGPDIIARAISPKLTALWGSACDSREPSRRGRYSGARFFNQQLNSSRWPQFCDHSLTSADVRLNVGFDPHRNQKDRLMFAIGLLAEVRVA